MTYHFKQIETYKHKLAKGVLVEWLNNNPKLINITEVVKIKLEEHQCEKGFIIFCPDITIYDNSGICAFIEVTNTNAISDNKIDKIYRYLEGHNWTDIRLIEINADYILNQTKEPEVLKYSDYKLFNHNIF